jgi:hypothetical protein
MLRNLFALLCLIAPVAGFAQTNSKMTNTTVTVTNSAPTTVKVFDPNRTYLQIQNNDPAGIIYINPSTAASSTGAIVLNPGQAWAPLTIPAGPISILGSIASNPNVTVTTSP